MFPTLPQQNWQLLKLRPQAISSLSTFLKKTWPKESIKILKIGDVTISLKLLEMQRLLKEFLIASLQEALLF
jgi:hypothetical protein